MMMMMSSVTVGWWMEDCSKMTKIAKRQKKYSTQADISQINKLFV